MSQISWANHMTAALGVSDLERSIAWYHDVLGFELIYKLDDWGWAELRSPLAEVNVGIGQAEELEPRGVRPSRSGSPTSTPPGPTWRPTTSASTARPPRCRGWCGWRRSTTPTATRSCSPSGSTAATAASAPGSADA